MQTILNLEILGSGGAVSLTLKRIDIRNSRSILEISFCPCDLAVLIGKSGSGKSNAVRALNLYFNGITSRNEEIDWILIRAAAVSGFSSAIEGMWH